MYICRNFQGKFVMTTYKIRLIGLLYVIVLLLAGSCGKDDPERIAEKDREKILDYIKKNDIDAIEHESGVFYYIENEGSGILPKTNTSVRVYLTGTLLNGKNFEPTRSKMIDLQYPDPPGFKYVLPLFRRGSNGIIIVPSGLGYGENSYYMGIPTNSVLIYEIEIIDYF